MIIRKTSCSLKNRFFIFQEIRYIELPILYQHVGAFRQFGMYQTLFVLLYYLNQLYSWTLKIINVINQCKSV